MNKQAYLAPEPQLTIYLFIRIEHIGIGEYRDLLFAYIYIAKFSYLKLSDHALGMNKKIHSITKKMPYKVFFNWAPQWEERVVVAPNMQVDQIEKALFDRSEEETLDDQVWPGTIYYILVDIF